ncbi:MAG: divalent-cation tolerance protein CutA [Pirellulales bacterium]|nr:divalent-cation tolerance protein CutA [Pirellulales bacterium]
MSSRIEVITTTETQAEARRIAQALVESRLAACVQIRGPIESTYRWKGRIETAQEWQCVVKTRRELFSRVEQAIASQHSYEVPEILAVQIIEASQPYAAWLDEQVGQ